MKAFGLLLAMVPFAGCASSGGGEKSDAALHRATVVVEARSGSNVAGTVTFEETGIKDGKRVLRVLVNLSGLSPGEHGFHVHEKGDCSDPKAASAGPHFDIDGHPHGGMHEGMSHAGDLGNVTANEGGVAIVTIDDVTKIGLSASAPNSIIGRAVVVHANQDDLKSQPAGDAGDRLGCGVIALDR